MLDKKQKGFMKNKNLEPEFKINPLSKKTK